MFFLYYISNIHTQCEEVLSFGNKTDDEIKITHPWGMANDFVMCYKKFTVSFPTIVKYFV